LLAKYARIRESQVIRQQRRGSRQLIRERTEDEMRLSKPADELPGLETLDVAERARVLEVGRVVHIPADWAPIRDGEPADEAYLVLQGTMRVDNGSGHVADIAPGGLAGEMGLVDRRLRNARVTTVGDVRVLAFPKGDFNALRRELPGFDELVRRSTRARQQ
jgi:CRP/FNR family cyclic AMP-dependent transcriptional regulator